MKTNILGVLGTWEDVRDDCRETVSKPPIHKPVSSSFKESMLITEHSPIRDISIRWEWKDIKSWIATHWVRHRWEHRVSTQRDDRTGQDRNKKPQDSPVIYRGMANTQNLIDAMRKRLCRQAHPETRAYANDLKVAIHEVEPEIADVLVPHCVYRAGCPELKPCGEWEKMNWWAVEKYGFKISDMTTIGERYKLYNEYFGEVVMKNGETEKAE